MRQLVRLSFVEKDMYNNNVSRLKSLILVTVLWLCKWMSLFLGNTFWNILLSNGSREEYTHVCEYVYTCTKRITKQMKVSSLYLQLFNKSEIFTKQNQFNKGNSGSLCWLSH